MSPDLQTSSLTYDLLGRLVQRVEPEGTSTWTYDTGAGAGIGKIAQEEGPNGDFLRTYSYDALGRSDSTATAIDGRVYTTSQSYDTEGRLDRLTYPSGFAVDHLYNADGYLEMLLEAGGAGTAYWEGLAANARGQITAERLGAGLTSYKSYDPETELPSRIETFRGLAAVQDETFSFDLVGNLMKRADMLRDREEVFAYDNLNRLTLTSLTVKSTGAVLSSRAQSYDALGNITSKAGVGTYSYGSGNTGPGAAGPHAVIAAGGKTYQYDANGSMTSGTGRSVLWSSFNKPIDITNTQTGEGTAFTYGPDRSRYKQVIIKLSGLTTVDYVGSLYEFHAIDNAPDERRHYIRGPGGTIAIYTQEGDGPTPSSDKTRYLLKDHLGSITTITDENGTVSEALSYDPWGERRNAGDWSLAAGPLESLETRRGFTGHEMLEEVGLIHMNGRVYDPVLGRFLSADPFVQYPDTTQGFNRYSYIENNPLSFTDPSGFFFGEGNDSSSYGGFNNESGGVQSNGSVGNGRDNSDNIGDLSNPNTSVTGGNLFERATTFAFEVYEEVKERLASLKEKLERELDAEIGFFVTGRCLDECVGLSYFTGTGPGTLSHGLNALVDACGVCFDDGFYASIGSHPATKVVAAPLGLAAKGVKSYARFTKRLRNKFKRVENEIAAGGMRGVTGTVTPAEARTLGERFVGPDFIEGKTKQGTTRLESKDGLRQFRGPSPKGGFDRINDRPFSNTGSVVNFESRPTPSGRFENNVHLDVER